MKRISLVLILMSIVSLSYGNPITFINETKCDFKFVLLGYEQPYNPSTPNVIFQSDEIIIRTGSTYFATPGDVPGNSGLGPMATFYYIKGFCDDPLAFFDIVLGDVILGFDQEFESIYVGHFPNCNGNNPYKVEWFQNAMGEIKVIISSV